MKRTIIKSLDAQTHLIKNSDGKIVWSLGRRAEDLPLKKRLVSPPLPPSISLPLPPTRPTLSPSNVSPIMLDESKSPRWKSPILMAKDCLPTPPPSPSSLLSPSSKEEKPTRKSPSNRIFRHSLSSEQIKSSSPSPSCNVSELEPSPKGLFKVPMIIGTQPEPGLPKIEAIHQNLVG